MKKDYTSFEYKKARLELQQIYKDYSKEHLLSLFLEYKVPEWIEAGKALKRLSEIKGNLKP